MFLSAEIDRRLHDPTLFDSGLEPILREVVATIIDQETVIVNWKIERIALYFGSDERPRHARLGDCQQRREARFST